MIYTSYTIVLLIASGIYYSAGLYYMVYMYNMDTIIYIYLL